MNHPVKLLCRMMQVSRSVYYAYARGTTYRETAERKAWQEKVRIVSWQVAHRMTAQLVTDAFGQSLRRGLLKRGAIIHTDRDSQYAATHYRRLLYINGFRQSMSRKGNCYDNAQAESFFLRFKAELVENGIFESVEDAKSEVFSYIEGYYNRIRLHSGLGYKSPI